MTGNFTGTMPTTLEAMIALVERDLPNHVWSVNKCLPSCPFDEGYVATLEYEEPQAAGTPRVYIVTPEGLAEQRAALQWGNHGHTPFEALRNVYTQVTTGEQA